MQPNMQRRMEAAVMCAKGQELREEALKSWDCIVSNKLVYGTESIKSNFEITHALGFVDWFSKYNSGDLYLEINLAFLGNRNCYARCMAIGIGRSKRSTNSKDSQSKINGTDRDDLMLINIAKLVDLPEGVVLKCWPSRIWLKRLDNLEGFRGYASNLFLETLIGRARTFGLNGERSQSTRLVCGQQGELPCKMVEAGADVIGELSDQGADGIRSAFVLSAENVSGFLNIVVSPFGVGLAINTPSNFHFELAEVFIRPTKLHLCIGKPDAHGAGIISACTMTRSSDCT